MYHEPLPLGDWTHTRVINCKIEGELKRKVKNYQPNISRDCEGVTKCEDACNSSR
jgi:hypothetical protein